MTGIRHLALALAGLVSAPAVGAADDGVLARLAARLDQGDGTQMQAAYAACILGKGNPEATIALFTAKGWRRDDTAKAGRVTLSPGTDALYATVAMDGSFCDVTSLATGTDDALSVLNDLTRTAALPVGPADVMSTCLAMTLGPEIVAEVLSGGSDPVCASDTDSAVRIHFALAT